MNSCYKNSDTFKQNLWKYPLSQAAGFWEVVLVKKNNIFFLKVIYQNLAKFDLFSEVMIY